MNFCNFNYEHDNSFHLSLYNIIELILLYVISTIEFFVGIHLYVYSVITNQFQDGFDQHVRNESAKIDMVQMHAKDFTYRGLVITTAFLIYSFAFGCTIY